MSRLSAGTHTNNTCACEPGDPPAVIDIATTL